MVELLPYPNQKRMKSPLAKDGDDGVIYATYVTLNRLKCPSLRSNQQHVEEG